MDDTTRRGAAEPRWPAPDDDEVDVDAGPDPLVGARLADLPPVAAALIGDPQDEASDEPET